MSHQQHNIMIQRRRDGVKPDMPTASEREDILAAIGGKPYWGLQEEQCCCINKPSSNERSWKTRFLRPDTVRSVHTLYLVVCGPPFTQYSENTLDHISHNALCFYLNVGEACVSLAERIHICIMGSWFEPCLVKGVLIVIKGPYWQRHLVQMWLKRRPECVWVCL